MLLRRTSLALLSLALLACSVERLPDTDTSAGTIVSDSSVRSTESVRDTARTVADTLVGIAPEVAAAPAPVAPADPADTMPLIAAPAELEELSARLGMPVQGIALSEIHDTYAEARGGRVHEALDILAPRGTPVLSATDGRLLRLHDSPAGGLMIYAADASDRFILMYGHLERYADGLAEGMPLRRGQTIGYVGTSGNAAPDAPHLHFAIARGRPAVRWWKGTPVNPYPLLAH